MQKIKYCIYPFLLFVILVLGACSTTRHDKEQTIETDWLKPIEGYTGSIVGAEVQQVYADKEGKLREIVVSLPADINTDEIDTVRVIDRDGADLLIDTAPAFNEYGEEVGVILKLNRPRSALPVFKILLSDPDDEN